MIKIIKSSKLKSNNKVILNKEINKYQLIIINL